MENNKPEMKYRAGGVIATIWKNQAEIKGKTMEYSSVTIERRYKDKKDEWQSTNSMKLNDLPKAILVMQKAYEHIVLSEAEASTKKGSKTNNSGDDEYMEEELIE